MIKEHNQYRDYRLNQFIPNFYVSERLNEITIRSYICCSCNFLINLCNGLLNALNRYLKLIPVTKVQNRINIFPFIEK